MKKIIFKFGVGMFIIAMGILAINVNNSKNVANAKMIVPCKKATNQSCTYKDAQGDEHTLTEARLDSSYLPPSVAIN